MNSLIQQFGDILKSTQELRNDLMTVLTDDDLAYQLPGRNGTLGELCREMGDIQQAYIEGFKTFKQDFMGHQAGPEYATQVNKLKAWYDELDQALLAVLEGLSEEDLQQPVDRGHGFAPPALLNFHIYREALLIFYAKVHIYLKALEKSVPGRWQWWIGDKADWLAAT
ncbi:MAG: hypothetical protein GYB65_16590 [Chloroflexi bacterium]|nr:hypothetical protein [Chloroflexota bacterium]